MFLIIAVLVVLWLLGLLGRVGGDLIHLLLVVALIVFLYNMFSNRRY